MLGKCVCLWRRWMFGVGWKRIGWDLCDWGFFVVLIGLSWGWCCYWGGYCWGWCRIDLWYG